MFWEYRQVLLRGLAFNGYVFFAAGAVALVGRAWRGAAADEPRPGRFAGSARCTSRVFRNAPDYIMVVWVHFVLPLLIGALIGRRVEFPRSSRP